MSSAASIMGLARPVDIDRNCTQLNQVRVCWRQGLVGVSARKLIRPRWTRGRGESLHTCTYAVRQEFQHERSKAKEARHT